VVLLNIKTVPRAEGQRRAQRGSSSPYTKVGITVAPLVSALLVNFGGSMGGNEQWRCGVWMAGDGTLATQSQLNQLASDAKTALISWWTSSGMNGIKGNDTTLDNVVVYSYELPGGPAQLRAEAAINAAAGSNATTMPNQCALVVSLRSAVPARTSSGRFYLPCKSGALTNAQLSPTLVPLVSAQTAALLSAFNASSATTDVVVGGSNAAPITNVVVDGIIDTQRRRRNAMVAATKTSTPLP